MKKVSIATLSVLALLSFVACGGGDADHGEAAAAGHDSDAGHAAEEAYGAESAEGATAMAVIEAKNDSGVSGSATFTTVEGQVMMTLEVSGATPGEHAFHLHEVGDCSADDGTSAGGHWNPTHADHGKWGEGAFHLGDVGNLVVDDEGNGSMTVGTNLWTIGTGEESDIVGRAVIVHAGVDDFQTQPTGAAGGRIGCGVIKIAE